MANTTKTCFKCSEPKPLDSFYAHPGMADGHLGKCKECMKKDVLKNRNEKREYYLKYDRSRAMLPHRVKARAEYTQTAVGRESHRRASRTYYHSEQGKEVARVWGRAYAKTPRRKASQNKYARSPTGRIKIRAAAKRARLKYPDRAKARDAVNYQIRTGRLKRLPCEVCGAERTQAHHDDYSKPLEVKWLCMLHHREADRKRSTLSNDVL